ncbi:hypothetical protein [Azospira sp. I13]|uniref:hypothetical protein n=1 Tax=Azospira sp. I13 TaxID=1765050 RepID=UPI001057AD7F|nr:hypothetical protein [Azospira sp. I13]
MFRLPLRLLVALLLGLCVSTAALAHGHPVAVADDDPEAPRLKLCLQAEAVALNALGDRERGLPLRAPPSGVPHEAFLAALAARVHAEPGIRSPKFAQSFARGQCNAYWDAQHGDSGAP